MKPYASYKPSGVPWLGDVPESWGVERLRFRVKLNPSLSKPLNADLPVSFLPMEAVGDDGTLDLERTRLVGEVAAGYTYFEDGDVTIAKITPCYENGKGAVMAGLLEGVGFGTTELIVMRPIQGDCPKWLYYLTMCGVFRLPGEASMQGAGGQKRVSDLFVKDYFAPVPTPDEQQAIADYLDVETARIDTLIHEKDELIGLLREWRQSVIAEAVTKGLNKDAPMKASGVAVLGEVPSHWEVKKIRYVLEAIGDVDHFMPESVDKGVPYLMTGDLKDLVSEVSLDDCKQVAYKDYLALSKRIKSSKGDVVMARYATIGTAMYVDMDIDFLVSYSCVTLKPNQSNMSGLYLFQYMKSDAFLHGVENQINTNTQGNVGISDLQNVMIAVPPLPEQKAISDYLDTETAKIDGLIAHTHDEITLLKELRAATIADAVLGRIDVRGTAKTIAACD